MEEYTFKKLQIDERFRRLVCPMDRQSFAQLEADILSGRRIEPLVVWDGFLIEGFNRYKIYSEHQLPFCTKAQEFSCWQAAAAWICVQQLKRDDIPEARRRFLIGAQYLLETEEAKLRFSGRLHVKQYGSACHRIAVRLGAENHVARATVQKYAAYTQTLELVRERAPKIAEDILAGRSKISQEKLTALSQLEEQAFQQAVHRLETARELDLSNKMNRKGYRKMDGDEDKLISGPSVKDMPAFDPDAEITGLTLTVPSWSGSINRILAGTDLRIVSVGAKKRLASALLRLQEKISETLTAIGVE